MDTTLRLSMEGKVYLEEIDKNENVVTREELDSDTVLHCVRQMVEKSINEMLPKISETEEAPKDSTEGLGKEKRWR